MHPLVRAGIGLALVGVSFLAGWRLRPERPLASPDIGRVLYYQDPMHPAYRSDTPGTAPDCGMALEPVYAGGRPAASHALAPGAVRVPAETRRLAGIRVAEVRRASPVHEIRTIGRVAADERRVYRITAFVTGLVRRTYSQSVGSLVRKDEPLARVYTRELRNAQQAYLYALDPFNTATPPQGDAGSASLRRQVQLAADVLIGLGMTDAQIAGLAESRAVSSEIDVVAPEAGFVLARNVSPGQRVDAGSELFVIGDLSRILVLADVFPDESDEIAPGQRAEVRLAGGSRTFTARVGEVLPRFDAATRTLKVRLELENPRYVLRPDMFVDVQFPVRLPPALVVPADALIQSGLHTTVFVDRGDGGLEPRRVETGRRLGDSVQIVSGLSEGERIVVSGTFLIDAESRLRAAAVSATTAKTVKDPVCGMDVDPLAARAAGRVIEHDGRSDYFCSAACQDQFKSRR